VLAPDLGDNPDTNCECFFMTTKVIEKGDFFLWHYGLFHGIFKAPCSDDNDDVVGDDEESELEADYEADFSMAKQLSMTLNGHCVDANDSNKAIEMEADHEANVLMEKELSSSLNGHSLDDNGIDELGKRVGAQIVRPEEKLVKTKKKKGACATVASLESTGILPTPSSTHQATAETKKQDRAERRRMSHESAQEEQELIRLDAAARYRSGELTFVATASPESYHDVTSAHQATADSPSRHERSSKEDTGRKTPPLLSDISSDGERDFPNESKLQAEEDQTVTVELSSMSAADIWDTLFCNKKLKGGYLARSLLLAGRDVDAKICEPWVGSKTLCSKKQEVFDQRKMFLQWAGEIRVLKWIRNAIFSIVVAKPHTYKLLNVEHAEFPRKQSDDRAKDGLTLTVLEATDDTMGRIAHLACDSECRNLLNMIYGAKHREVLDSKDLQEPALWQDLADQFVNNSQWQPNSLHVAQLDYMKVLPDGSQQMSKRIDPSLSPYPGISGECVRDNFTALKAMFKTLGNRVFGRTGCNSTGEELYGSVWKNYIKGKYLYFPRPEVTMYLFKLWNECEALPKWCIKELNPEAQVRVGVSSSVFSFPVTPRSSSSSNAVFSPTLTGTSSTVTTSSIDKLSQYLELETAIKLRSQNEDFQKPKVF
jgi:hypothetical protein